LTLLALVVIRAVAVWRSVDAAPHTHDHDHDHEHCGHDHGDCGHEHEHGIQSATQTTGFSAAATPPALSAPVHHHDHDHGHNHSHDHGHDHDHGWAPWRYVVLLLPVVLYFLNLPNQGFTADASGGLNLAEFTFPKMTLSKDKASIGFAELQQ